MFLNKTQRQGLDPVKEFCKQAGLYTRTFNFHWLTSLIIETIMKWMTPMNLNEYDTRVSVFHVARWCEYRVFLSFYSNIFEWMRAIIFNLIYSHEYGCLSKQINWNLTENGEKTKFFDEKVCFFQKAIFFISYHEKSHIVYHSRAINVRFMNTQKKITEHLWLLKYWIFHTDPYFPIWNVYTPEGGKGVRATLFYICYPHP